jgi:DNA-binding Lrp family transcriptional regulator
VISKACIAFEMDLLHNNFMENIFTLNKQQLELLQDFTNYPILQIFEKPHNPTQVAKGLKMPANALHYRVKKLAEVGLLKLVSQKGRIRQYQSVGTNFRVHRDVFQSHEYSFGFTKDLFDKVAKGFHLAEEEFVEKGLRNKDSEYIHFGLNDSGETVLKNHEPCLATFEMPLTQEQYRRLTKEILKIAHEVQKEEMKKNSKACTIAIAAFPKSSIFPGL